MVCRFKSCLGHHYGNNPRWLAGAFCLDAFRGKIGTSTIVSGADAFYVLHINKEIAPKIDTKKMADIRKELQNASQTNVMDDYNSFLLREYPIEINEKIYNRVFTK